MPRGLICPEEPKNGRVYKDVICAFMEENAAEDRYGGQDSQKETQCQPYLLTTVSP